MVYTWLLVNILYRKDSVYLISKYIQGYLAFMRYGRMSRMNATNKYFDKLRAKLEHEAGTKIAK